MERKKILITGGTGTVGLYLTERLQKEGHQIVWLSRKAKTTTNGVKIYDWDVQKSHINPAAIVGITHVIHLAGAGVADEAWTEERKKEILESRVKSAELLFRNFAEAQIKPECFVSASATGYYGIDTGSTFLSENAPCGDGFLSEVCRSWEDSCQKFEQIGTRSVSLRIGIVLSKKGGAFEKMIMPVRLGLGAALGSGQQYISWIHAADLANMFYFAAFNNNLRGKFNAVAPNPVSNEDFNKTAAKVLGRPLFLPNIPSFFLEIVLGERAALVLGGNRVSAEKILQAGFLWQFPELTNAVKDLI